MFCTTSAIISKNDEPDVLTWQRWETSLRASCGYANPYKDVTVSVTYTGPQGQTMKCYGFWDGGNTFKIRASFPSEGIWIWKTSCSNASDEGLHNRTGIVSVGKYQGDNDLYKHGFIKTSQNKKYLVFDDNIPFFWVGDTIWLHHVLSQKEWEKYIDDRYTKGFTVIQTSAASNWSEMATQSGRSDKDYNGNTPFIGQGLEQWNPDFWKELDFKVEYANQKGLVVFLIGIMDPLDTVKYDDVEGATVFARNIAARLYGNFVVFSPTFDVGYNPIADAVGEAIKNTTSLHLVAIHPGTSKGMPTNIYADAYYDKYYVDMIALQTGHNGGDRNLCAKQAIEWNLYLYSKIPPKPIVCVETFYDDNGTSGKTTGKYSGTAKDERSLSYLSILSGSMGIGYGVRGIIKADLDPDSPSYWEKALSYPSSMQMKYLSDFFKNIEWYTLVPRHDLVLNNSTDYLKKMVFSKNDAGTLGVAYLQDNESIQLDLSEFGRNIKAIWFDPVNNTKIDIEQNIPNTSVYTFIPPQKGEWILLIKSQEFGLKKASKSTLFVPAQRAQIHAASEFSIRLLSITDMEGNFVAELKANKFIKANVDVKNNSGEMKDAALIVALCDSKEDIKNICVMEQNIEDGKSIRFSAGFKLPENINDMKLKIFMCNSLELKKGKMQPVSDVIIFIDESDLQL